MNVRAQVGAVEAAGLARDEAIALYRRSIVAASDTRSYLATIEASLRSRRLNADAEYMARRVTDLTRYIVNCAARLRELRDGAAC